MSEKAALDAELGSNNPNGAMMENHAHPCEWVVSLNDKYADCDCHQFATRQVDGKWWCEFHASAVTLQPRGIDGVLLPRVSSEDQADSGYSLPTQIEGCLRYAVANRIRVHPEHVFIEDISGTVPIAERPIQKKALDVLKRREARAVLAHQVDRLSRDIVDLLASVRSWLRAGVEVHSCDIGKVNSELDIVLVIKGWQGSDERVKIIERCTRGRNGKARAGKVVGCGRAPFGYQYSDGCLIIIEEQAKIVRLIFVWYTRGDGNDKPMTIKKIARRLTEMGIPVPGKDKNYSSIRRRSANIWSAQTVHSILTNEVYAGTLRFGKHIGKSFGGGKRPISERIPISVPPIVDRDLWEAAQLRRQHNRKMASRNAKREYLLRGIVFCKNRHSMIGSSRAKYYSYYCSHRYNRYPGLEQQCQQKEIRGERLESLTWSHIVELLSDPDRFEQALRDAQKMEQLENQPTAERLQLVLDLIRECESEAGNLAKALTNVQGGVVGRALEAQVVDVEARHAALTKERDMMQAKLQNLQFSAADIETALEFRRDALAGMNDPDFACKRRILELLQVRVIVDGHQAQIQCLIPTGSTSINYNNFYTN